MSRATLALGAVATAIGVTGVVVGCIALAKVDAAHSAAPATVTATPEPSSPSATDMHAAAVEACAAAETFRTAFRAVRQPYVDAVTAGIDANSPEFIALEGRYFGGVAAELDYLTAHSSPFAPQEITDHLAVLQRAAAELVDTDVRSEPGAVSNEALARLRSADSALTAACDAAGASR
jgi:hypothetical protein